MLIPLIRGHFMENHVKWPQNGFQIFRALSFVQTDLVYVKVPEIPNKKAPNYKIGM
jgi:hypothetical protein